MGDAKPGIVMANRDRELLIPVAEDDHDSTPKPSPSSSSSSSSTHHAGQECDLSFDGDHFLCDVVEEVPEHDYMIPLPEAEVISEGNDITLVGRGAQLTGTSLSRCR